MFSSRGMVLFCGLLCAAVGGMLIAARGKVESAIGFGIPIVVGGLLLVVISLRPARRDPSPDDTADAPPPIPKPPGVWFPIGLALILGLQAVYLIWWSVFGRK